MKKYNNNFINKTLKFYKLTIFLFFCLILFIVPLVQGCTTQEVKLPPDEVTVQLKWVHQSQFAGLYVAQQKGYYADENINVKFIEGGQGIDVVEPLLNGQADFTIISPEFLITEHSKGAPIWAIAAITGEVLWYLCL
jgi:NitT/TauT family transport system substrate-binding protein